MKRYSLEATIEESQWILDAGFSFDPTLPNDKRTFIVEMIFPVAGTICEQDAKSGDTLKLDYRNTRKLVDRGLAHVLYETTPFTLPEPKKTTRGKKLDATDSTQSGNDS